jgi:ADP-ribosylglycohydrolase
LLVGDALGVPYEFHPPAAIPAIEEIDLEPPAGFERSHARVPPGTYSDDGAQALCLLDSLLSCDTFDPEDLGRRLVRWYQAGYLAVDGEVFDCGVQTGAALRALIGGAHAVQAGPSLVSANGNGSLMRVLPLALWHRGPDAELVAFARDRLRGQDLFSPLIDRLVALA